MISQQLEQPGVMGVQQPRLFHVPEYVSSAGAEAIELAALAGLVLDPWEQFVLTHALGETAQGRWASFEVGLVVPRQNGKGAILEARELAGLFLFGEQLIIHSAHEQATSSEHFRRLLNLIEGVPEFERRVLKAPKGKGAEAIELRGGQRIFFKTRTAGGGRGLTGDLVVLDEAMILQDATIAALVPTMAARSVHGNPQLWYAGSSVDQEKHEHGVVLARVRERGLAGKLAYFEHSAPGDDPNALSESERHDPALWAVANPGLGIRISLDHVAAECDGALGPREFAVERLGVGDWPATDGSSNATITGAAWGACEDPGSACQDPVFVVFDVTPDRSSAAIGAAGWRTDELAHVEIITSRDGTGWVAGALAKVVQSQGIPMVFYDERSAAAALVPEVAAALIDLDVELRPVATKELAEACGIFFDAVVQDKLRHLGTTELRQAVAGAAIRPLGDAWAWARRTSSANIAPLVAVTLALWGLKTFGDSTGEPLVGFI
jgi:hypothetical protein